MNDQALNEARLEVLARIKTVAGRHAEVVAELVALLAHAKAISAAELGAGRSLFSFCQNELNLSRDQSYRYLACADVVAKHPRVLDALKAGRLNATGVAALASYVKANNLEDGADALQSAEGKTVEAIELLVVELCPKPDVKLSVRPSLSLNASKQPGLMESLAVVASTASHSILDAKPLVSSVTPPPARAKAVPLSPSSYKVTMTLSAEAYKELQELRDLVSHIVPHGELDKVIAHGIRIAVKQARKAKWKTDKSTRELADAEVAPTRNSEPSAISTITPEPFASSAEAAGPFEPSEPSRSSERPESSDRGVNPTKRDPIPAPVRRAVYIRDGGRCAFSADAGVVCGSTWQVEVDHIQRVADGGETTLANLRLCCRMHNQARERDAA